MQGAGRQWEQWEPEGWSLAVPHPHCIPICSDLLRDGHSLAWLENQVVLLCSGAAHGLACGILDTPLLVQVKALPSPNLCAPTQHISATAPGKQGKLSSSLSATRAEQWPLCPFGKS